MIFVSSPIDVLTGDDAKHALATTNDTRFETEDGVLVVDKERWQQAQEYERRTWMELNLGAMEDRNNFHADMFAQYAALPQELGDVIELGCGVFTNTRHILNTGRTASSITLIDPLIEDYKTHPNCAYADGTINGMECTLVNKAVEAYSTKKRFDTLILVNVLTHCYDAPKVLKMAHTWLKDGGWLVFAEFPQSASASDHYDVGHPIMPKEHVLETFLGQFEVKHRDLWYVIGQKV